MENEKMGKLLLILAVLQLGFLSTTTEAADAGPVAVTFGGLQIFPVLDVTEEYNSNLFQADTTDVQTSTAITKLSPSLEVGIESGSTEVSVHYQFDKGIHHNASIADYADQTVTLKGESGLTKRLNAGVSLTYKKGHELRGISQSARGQIFFSPDKLTTTNIQGKVGYGIRGRIDLFGELNKKLYDDLLRGQAADVDTMKTMLALSFPIRSKGRAILEARYSSNDFKSASNTFDNSEQSYYVGVDWDNNSKTTGRVRLGYLLSSYDQLSNDSFFSWEIDATWKPTDSSSFNFNTSYRPVGRNAEYGYAVANMNRLSWEHSWSDSLKQTASIGYDLIDYNTPIIGGFVNFLHKEKLAKVSLGVDYKMRRWLMIGGGYTFSNRSSNQTTTLLVANPTYRQHILSINLTGTL